MATRGPILFDYSSKYSKISPESDILTNLSWKQDKNNNYILFLIYKVAGLDYVKYLTFYTKETEISFRRDLIVEVMELCDKELCRSTISSSTKCQDDF